MTDPARVSDVVAAIFMALSDPVMLSAESKGFIFSIRMLEEEIREAALSG